MTKATAIIALIAALGLACAPAAPAAQKDSAKTKAKSKGASSLSEEDRLLLNYYKAPDMEKAAKILSMKPKLGMDSYMAGFRSEILRSHTKELPELLSKCTVDTLTLKCGLSLALWLANTPECKAEAFAMLEKDEVLTRFVKFSKESKHPSFRKLEKLHAGMEEVPILEMAWGAYDATHDPAILKSLIRLAGRAEAPKDGVKSWMAKEEDRKKPLDGCQDMLAMTVKVRMDARAQKDADFATELKALLNTMPAETRKLYNRPMRDYFRDPKANLWPEDEPLMPDDMPPDEVRPEDI